MKSVKRLLVSTLALFSVTTVQITATARPLNESEQEVEAQIRAVIEAQDKEGYQLVFPRTVARLSRGAQAPKTVFLSPSREYSFVAVCNKSCEDVDIIVEDMQGNVVASDMTDYAVAVVPFVPPAEDRYEINVKMSKCSSRNRTCDFGLGVFVKAED